MVEIDVKVAGPPVSIPAEIVVAFRVETLADPPVSWPTEIALVDKDVKVAVPAVIEFVFVIVLTLNVENCPYKA